MSENNKLQNDYDEFDDFSDFEGIEEATTDKTKVKSIFDSQPLEPKKAPDTEEEEVMNIINIGQKAKKKKKKLVIPGQPVEPSVKNIAEEKPEISASNQSDFQEQSPVSSHSSLVQSESNFEENMDIDGFEVVEEVDNSSEEDIGVEEVIISEDKIKKVEIPTNLGGLAPGGENKSLDYKIMEDKLSRQSLRVSKLEGTIKSLTGQVNQVTSAFNETSKTLPEILVKEADTKIRANIEQTVKNTISQTMGEMVNQLQVVTSFTINMGVGLRDSIIGMLNYINLINIKLKVLEVKLAMLNGKTYSEQAKQQLELKLKKAKELTEQMKLSDIAKFAETLAQPSESAQQQAQTQFQQQLNQSGVNTQQ